MYPQFSISTHDSGSDFLRTQFLQVESYVSRGRPDWCWKSLHNPVTNIVHQLRPQCGSWWVMQILHILRSVELVCWTLVSLMHTSRNIMLEMPPCFSRWKLRWLLLLQSCVIPVKWLKPSTNSVTIQELGKVWYENPISWKICFHFHCSYFLMIVSVFITNNCFSSQLNEYKPWKLSSAYIALMSASFLAYSVRILILLWRSVLNQ